MAEEKKNVGGAQRRTWDVKEYEKKAQERLAREEGGIVEGDVDDRPVRDRDEFRRAEDQAAGPAGSARAFLNNRNRALGLEKAAGKTQIIADNGLRQKGGGWYCDVCECLLKDSSNYLDHINGKKHQRKLGFSMRVERSTVGQVSERFKLAKKRKEDEMSVATRPTAIEAYEQRIAAAQEEEERAKRAKKEAKQAQKREKEALEMEGMDPDLMAAMGFGGFGGGAKGK
uniref:U1-type domain-containing protein n=1 Tax=Rhizochromulina marina TaxID=1034831 RepID=A0A7S2WR40_9STRA